jgi:hypothetical protein
MSPLIPTIYMENKQILKNYIGWKRKKKKKWREKNNFFKHSWFCYHFHRNAYIRLMTRIYLVSHPKDHFLSRTTNSKEIWFLNLGSK